MKANAGQSAVECLLIIMLMLSMGWVVRSVFWPRIPLVYRTAVMRVAP